MAYKQKSPFKNKARRKFKKFITSPFKNEEKKKKDNTKAKKYLISDISLGIFISL